MKPLIIRSCIYYLCTVLEKRMSQYATVNQADIHFLTLIATARSPNLNRLSCHCICWLISGTSVPYMR